jgi:hypothetical protein
MTTLKRFSFFIFAILTICACKSNKKKINLAGEEKIDISDFIASFETVPLSYEIKDSIFLKKAADSLLISHKIFSGFVPDSVFKKVFGKTVHPKIYALAKVLAPKAESYLFVKALTKEKKAVYLLVFDDQNKFMACMDVMIPDELSSTAQSVTMDKSYAITKTVQQKNAEGNISEGKDVFTYEGGIKNFVLIMTDPLVHQVTEIINPIDTLPRTYKFSADYQKDKFNFISIRDGKKSDRVSFFINISKEDGKCIGELKGEAMLTANNRAEYREGGDPCSLQFIFSSNSVEIKEIEGCGSRRGLTCSFDGSFPKKKVIKPAEKKNEKTVEKKKADK